VTWFEYADPLPVDTSGPVDIGGLAATLARLLDPSPGT
jgi:hypothetical protein